VFHPGGGVAHINIGEGMGAALITDEQRVALGVVAGACRARHYPHQTPVGVLPMTGGDALGYDSAAGVLPQVDHLGAGVGLLVIIGQGHRIELAHGVVPLENTAGVLPGDGGAGLNLGPGDPGIDAPANPTLGDKIVYAAPALLVTGIPVLDGGILDLRIVQGDQFHHRRVELVLVAHGGGAAFQVAYVAALIGDDKGPLELAGHGGVDAEIGGQLHRAAYPLGDIDEGAVAEDRRVQGGEEVVGIGHHRAQVLPHQIGVAPHRLGEWAEDHPRLGQGLLEGGGHRYTVEDRVHRYPRQALLFLQGNAQLIVGLQQLGIYLVQAVVGGLLLGGGIIDDALVIDGLIIHVRPVGFASLLVQLEPVAIGLQTPFKEPVWFLLLC